MACPLCGAAASVVVPAPDEDGLLVTCEPCGRFRITPEAAKLWADAEAASLEDSMRRARAYLEKERQRRLPRVGAFEVWAWLPPRGFPP